MFWLQRVAPSRSDPRCQPRRRPYAPAHPAHPRRRRGHRRPGRGPCAAPGRLPTRRRRRSCPATTVPGAGIYLPGNAARALRDLGLDGPVRPLGDVVDAQRFLDETGQRALRGRPRQALGRRRRVPGAAPRRPAAGAAHRRSAARSATTPGSASVDLRRRRRRSTVTFDDGTERRVRPGGRRRRARARRSGRSAALGGPARPVGQVVYRSVVAGGPRITEWMGVLGRRSGFVVMPMGGGRLYLYADEAGTERAGRSAGPAPRGLRRLRRPGARRAGRGGQGAGRAHRRGRDRAAGRAGRSVLVGDAAHATAPTLSEGAAMALEDAVVLAEALTRAATVRRGAPVVREPPPPAYQMGPGPDPRPRPHPRRLRRRCATRCCAAAAGGSSASTTGCWSTRHERLERTQAVSGR